MEKYPHERFNLAALLKPGTWSFSSLRLPSSNLILTSTSRVQFRTFGTSSPLLIADWLRLSVLKFRYASLKVIALNFGRGWLISPNETQRGLVTLPAHVSPRFLLHTKRLVNPFSVTLPLAARLIFIMDHFMNSALAFCSESARIIHAIPSWDIGIVLQPINCLRPTRLAQSSSSASRATGYNVCISFNVRRLSLGQTILLLHSTSPPPFLRSATFSNSPSTMIAFVRSTSKTVGV